EGKNSLLYHPQEMRDLGDHATGLRRIGHILHPTDPVEAEADKGLALAVMAADRTARLFDPDGLVGLAHEDLRQGFPCSICGRLGVDGIAASRLQGRNLDVAARSDRAWRILALQGIEGGAHHV